MSLPYLAHVTALVLVLLGVSCGGGSKQEARDFSPTDLVQRTLAEGSARIAWSEPVGPSRFTASGSADFSGQRGQASIYVDITGGGARILVAKLVLADSVLYLRQVSSTNGNTLQPAEKEAGGASDFLGTKGVPPGSSNLGLGFTSPGQTYETALVDLIGDADRFEYKGQRDVLGVRADFFAAAPSKDKTVTLATGLYVDSSRRIVRLEFPGFTVENVPPGAFSITLDLSDFGAPANITVP